MTEVIYCWIRVKGRLSEDWADWFAWLQLEGLLCGDTALYGALPDQSALLGALNMVHTLGIKLLSLVCVLSTAKEAGLETECSRQTS